MTSIPDNAEIFRLEENCEGVIWHDAAGWRGCLKWDLAGNTDFVGPCFTRLAAIQNVKENFLLSYSETAGATPLVSP